LFGDFGSSFDFSGVDNVESGVDVVSHLLSRSYDEVVDGVSVIFFIKLVQPIGFLLLLVEKFLTL